MMRLKTGTNLSELVDLAAFQQLQDDFSLATGIATSLMDHTGEVLTRSGWSDLCLFFHRQAAPAHARCRKSDRELAAAAARAREPVVRVCIHGLGVAAAPIFVAARHVATLYLSQVFFGTPDEAYYRRLAQKFGFDEEAYLAAVRRVPVVSEERFRRMARFFAHVATLFSGLAQRYREQQLLQAVVEREKARLAAIFQGSGDAMRIIDTEFRVREQNRRMHDLSGVPEGEALRRYCYQSFRHPYCGTERCVLRRILSGEPCVEAEVAMTRPDGKSVFVELIATPLRDEKGEVAGVIESFRDIGLRKEMEEQLRFLSMHDPLTGLYNRAYFEEEMRRLDGPRHRPVSIIVADLDGLKIVNDTLGHDRGDDYLCAAAAVIKSAFREEDCVARVGGDEFAVLLPHTDRAAAEAACRRIREAADRYNAANPLVPLSLSIGCATAVDMPPSLGQVYKDADDAMYREKILHRSSIRHTLIQTLNTALAARDFITEGHAARLEELSVRLGKAVGLPEEKLDNLRLLARFHDIGKVGVPDGILFKPGPLTPEERREMQRHCEIGHRIALASPLLAPIADLILMHHEWHNGQGYPLQLKGGSIPVECRILAIVDAYDAMTSDRPYRKAMPPEKAREELLRGAGTQFDPELVRIFLAVLDGQTAETAPRSATPLRAAREH
ncbi:MAG: PocR ligand-binding domain-containing protein [Bacillota bacterium]